MFDESKDLFLSKDQEIPCFGDGDDTSLGGIFVT